MCLTAQNVSLFMSAALALVIGVSIPNETAAALGWTGESGPGIVTTLALMLFSGLSTWGIACTPTD